MHLNFVPQRSIKACNAALQHVCVLQTQKRVTSFNANIGERPLAKATNDYTKMMKDMMGSFPVDTKAMEEQLKLMKQFKELGG